jgi:hypothetical protein
MSSRHWAVPFTKRGQTRTRAVTSTALRLAGRLGPYLGLLPPEPAPVAVYCDLGRRRGSSGRRAINAMTNSRTISSRPPEHT